MNSAALKKFSNLEQIREASRTARGRVESYPDDIHLITSFKCNYNCIYCNQDHASKAMLPLTAVQKLEPILPYVRSVNIKGGEPLLYPHLNELLEILNRYECISILVGNGSQLNEKRRQEIMDAGIYSIKISCDGSSAKTNNEIRRNGNFFQVMKNLRELNRLKERSRVRTPILQFNFTAMRRNVEELERLVGIAADLGVDIINVSYLNAHSEKTAAESLYFSQEYSDEMMLQAAQTARKLRVKINLPPLFGGQDITDETPDRHCISPWSLMKVSPTGGVGLCCGASREVGNIIEDDFAVVWNHPLRRKVRETVNTETPTGLCRRCSAHQNNPNTITSHIPDKDSAAKTAAAFAGANREVRAV